MKTPPIRIALFFVLVFGSVRVNAQANRNATPPKEPVKVEVSEPAGEDAKAKAARTFDEVKHQILQVTKELEVLGVKDIPVYPTHVSLESVTTYLEELTALNKSQSNPSTKSQN